MRESEGDLASEGGEGESRVENRGKRKRSSFVVESKVFEVVVEERNGKSHAIISESKGGVVSWVWLGPANVGLLIEGLIQCTKDGKDGRWEKGGKKKGGSIPCTRRGPSEIGWSAARAWGLKGKLGLARLGKGCALLEFETVEEAERVLAAG
ncbi:hypothetical protein CK203_084181 [Vitis vinifera]|uniref:DUF4283 domain-containing protein n=1 Tax=Vitis vinifera TaxID=29760 RepID=A0A438DR98_VITVI|nr:hypothetical protein CK203_084181 [Vitis vinifera]